MATLAGHSAGGPDPADDAPREALRLATELADVFYALQIEPEYRFEYVSDSVERMLGHTRQEFFESPSLLARLIDPDDSDSLDSLRHSLNGEVGPFMVRGVGPGGEPTWTEHYCRRVAHPDGRVVVYGAARDVTARREAEDELIEERERYRLLSENSLDVVYRTDVNRIITWISPSVTRAMSWLPEDLIGQSVASIIHPDDIAGVRAKQTAILGRGGDRGEAELRVAIKGGGWRWMRVVGRVVRDDVGTPIGGIDELRDIQAEVEGRALIAHQGGHDALTGLAKRALVLARMQEALDDSEGAGVTLLCVGVDGLTSINASFMHTAGDRVLVAVANRLVRAVGDADRVGRIAGDEFVILLTDCADEDEAVVIAAAVLAAARGPVAIGPHEIDVTVSIGVAVSVGPSAAELLRDAVTAMRQAGAHGRDRWEVLDRGMAHSARERLIIRNGLRDSIRDDRVRTWYQPIVSLADRSVVGYEALVRVTSPDGTVAGPADFLEVAERSGLIVPIDRIVLAQALNCLTRQPTGNYISVNVSAASLADEGFADAVAAAIDAAGADPRHVRLEVTETSIVHVSERVVSSMQSLAERGVTWWVDDFGTGFSSVSHLRDLPICGLKLDRSFTAGIGAGDERSVRVAHGLAGLAAGLGLDTVAEGVETEAEAAVLLGQGWGKGQGWLFGSATAEPWSPIRSRSGATIRR